MNTGLGVGRMPSDGWVAFRDYIKRSPDVDVGALIARGTPLSPEEVNAYRAPYDGKVTKAGVRRFPVSEMKSRATVGEMSSIDLLVVSQQLVPVHPSMRGVPDSRAALTYFQTLPPIAYRSNSLEQPSAPQSQGRDSGSLGEPLQVFVCVGKSDPVLGEPVMFALAQSAWGQSCGYWWSVIEEGGHFVQEWASHVPALADQAWSQEHGKRSTVKSSGGEASWVAGRAQSRM